jgi:hypothetical protein
MAGDSSIGPGSHVGPVVSRAILGELPGADRAGTVA